MVLKVDWEQGRVFVNQRVVYTNQTGRALNSIVFNVTPAHFGAFQLTFLEVDGAPVTPTIDGVVMDVPLPKPLQPDASATIRMSFDLTPPRPGKLRLGFSDGIMALGNWYPVVAVWRADDWDRHPYTDFGDAFFTEASDYRVTVGMSQPLVMAHTGRVIGRDGERWELEANGVRDFALALSDRYETLSSQVGRTTVTTYFLPEHSQGGKQYLQSAAESLAWFNQVLGEYPYPSLAIAETISHDPFFVGQEYPNLVFISSDETARGGGMGSYLSYLVVHEVLHQWFYGLVGNDQMYEPWLDEALTSQVSDQFFRFSYPSIYQSLWGSLVSRYRDEERRWGPRPVVSSIYDYRDETEYVSAVYRRGAIFLEELHQILGDESYFKLLRDYIATYDGEIASGQGFLAMAGARAGDSLKPLVQRYFRGYQIKSEGTPTPTPTATPTPTPSSPPVPSPTPRPVPTLTNTPSATPTPPMTPSPSTTSRQVLSPTPTLTISPLQVAPVSPIEDGSSKGWVLWSLIFIAAIGALIALALGLKGRA